MNLLNIQFWVFALPVVIVLTASFYDYRWRRIPNFITLPSMVIGLMLHGIDGGWNGLSYSLWGLTLGICVFLVLYLLGGIGAGDVKLMGSIGAFLGADLILSVFILTVLVGGFMASYKMVINGSLKQMKTRLISLSIRKNNYDPLKDTIPYGIAIAISTLITMALETLPEVIS
jgi:prepilin peptidase CpaA